MFEPCPFCGSENLKYYHGWFGGSREKAQLYQDRDKSEHRRPSLCCLGCEISFSTGVYGRGISDEFVKEEMRKAWNKRFIME